MRLRIWFAVLLSCSVAAGVRAQKWERLGPDGGMVVSLGTTASGDVYLGTSDGHVFLREGGAQRWELRGRVGSRTDAVVTRLVSDPREARRIYAAVWYQEPGAGGGVFRSEDGGKTWSPQGVQGEAVRALEIAPSHPEVLVAGARSGVFRSNNRGETWERISPVGDLELQNVDSLAIKPDDAGVIYAGTYHLPWKTVNGGKSWEPIAAGLIDDSDIMSLRVDATDPERVYLSACSGIYRSENQGGVWTKLQGIPYAARRTQAIVQDPENPKTLYAATTEGLWVTRDAGESWKRTTPKDWVVSSVAVLHNARDSGERVLVGTEAQGVLESSDGGESFVGVNGGFAHVVVTRLAEDYSESKQLLMLTQQGSQKMMESHDGGQNWTAMPLEALDGRTKTKLDNDAVDEIYGSPWGWLARMRNGDLWTWNEDGKNWSQWKLRATAVATKPKPRAGGNKGNTPITYIKLTPGGLAITREGLFVATRDGVSRCNRSGICVPAKVFGRVAEGATLWASLDGQSIVVVAGGKLGITQDAGKTVVWRDTPASGKQVRWAEIAFPSGNPAIFLGTDRGLLKSTDGGLQWKLQEDGLPAGLVENWLHRENLWVATLRGGGLYVSRDQGSSWARVDRDAERGEFTGLVEVEPGVVLAASQSEGLLRLNLRRAQ